MKANRLRWFLVFLLGSAAIQMPAQQSEADRKLLAETRAKAENGDAEAQNRLGIFYFSGQGVAKDMVQAVKWYRKGAEQNYAAAQCNLGGCYFTGQGVAQDEAEGLKWFRKPAEQNYAQAQYGLGVCYESALGVVKDTVQAVQWYRKAAEQNYAPAQCALGNCYSSGQGVAKDEVEGTKWFRKAAEQNYAQAQYNLGGHYANGKGIEKDEAEAVKWFRKAAEGGQVTPFNALNALAWILATSPNSEIRDGSNAVVFAEKSVAATNRKTPGDLDTLAAAYAETGQFEKAVSTQQEAIALLQTEAERNDYKSRLELFEAHLPYRAKD